ADVQRFLADEPVQACPPSAWYRFRKFARRNRGRLTVAGLVLLLLASLGGWAGWAAKHRADQAEEEARQESGRRAGLEADIVRNLDDTSAFCRADRLPDASASVKQAESLLARGRVREEFGPRVRRARAEVDAAVVLEDIRLAPTTAVIGKGQF